MRPSRAWHLVSLVIFLALGIALPVATTVSFIKGISSGQEFFTPGTQELNLKKQANIQFGMSARTSTTASNTILQKPCQPA